MAIAIGNVIKDITVVEFDNNDLTRIYCDGTLVWIKPVIYKTEQLTSAYSIGNDTNFKNGISFALKSSMAQNFTQEQYVYTLNWNFRYGSTSTASSVNFKITPKITNGTNTIIFDT